VVVVENSLAYFSIPLHHHFGYCHVPDFLHFDYHFLHDVTITLFWQIPPILDDVQHQVVIEHLQLIAVG